MPDQPTSPDRRDRLLVVLTSLRAEGTPVLTLDLCRRWMALGLSPHVVRLAYEPNDLEPEFRAAGISIETIDLPPTGKTRFAKLALGVYQICRRLKPHAVLSMPLGWHAFMFIGARLAGVKTTAAHVGNYPPHDDPRALARFRSLLKIGSPVTDALICCSAYVQSGVIEHFRIPSRATRVIYNGIDVDTISHRASSARRDRTRGKFVVGMVGTLEAHKDQPTLIRAAAMLKEGGHPVEVWLLGEGSRRQEYERLIKDLGLGDCVKLMGTRRDIPELLGQMDAFVFSAKYDEGLGVALIEAMAAGVPIIATNVGACREVSQDGLWAKLISAGDPSEMAQAITAVIKNPAENGEQRKGAERRASESFSIDAMARQYAKCLKLDTTG